MATLVSPGTSVTIIDDSFFIPVSAPTVPLFFVATCANKLQPDGVTSAAFTTEHSVVRTITSLGQSVTSYGIPKFRTADADATLPVSQRRQLHGDARNEYGLFALNQYLGIGNLAYVIRADVDLTDAQLTALATSAVTFTSVTAGNAQFKGPLTNFAIVPGYTTPETWTVTCVDNGSGYGNGTFSVTGSVSGLSQLQAQQGSPYNNGMISFVIGSGTLSFEIGDTFSMQTINSTAGSALGANDAAKRLAIVTALKAEINSNQEIRSEVYEYNLILCPGYFEVAEELLALSQSVND